MKIHPLEVFWTPYRGQKAPVAKKTHHFDPPPKFTHFFCELLNLIRYFHTFGQQNNVDPIFCVKRKTQPSPTQR